MTESKLEAVAKIEYKKDGVYICNGGLSGIDGFAFQTEINNEKYNGILTNGKLRRAERRKIVKALLYALKTDYLGDFPQIGDGVRGAVVHRAEDVK